MNCPKCRSGILEQMSIIQMKENGELAYTLTDDHTLDGIRIMVCSLDQCGYSELKATSGLLSTAKRIMRNRKYKLLTL